MSLSHGHNRRRSSSLERRDPYSSPSIYFDEDSVRYQLLGNRNRAVSSYIKPARETSLLSAKGNYPARRTSHDEHTQQNQELLVVVERTLKDLHEREDLDNNQQITIEDNGPKVSLWSFPPGILVADRCTAYHFGHLGLCWLSID